VVALTHSFREGDNSSDGQKWPVFIYLFIFTKYLVQYRVQNCQPLNSILGHHFISVLTLLYLLSSVINIQSLFPIIFLAYFPQFENNEIGFFNLQGMHPIVYQYYILSFFPRQTQQYTN
jgi:hypothetical protein